MNIKKKAIKIVLSSSTLLIIIGIILLIPIMMLYNFFGGEISDSGYVENNMEYAKEYKKVLNNYITKNQVAYIPLTRILYFYNEDSDLSFNEIYKNNIDEDLKTIKPINEVCLEHYARMDVCDEEELENSNQSDDYPYKPFNAPIEFQKTNISSYFAEERVIYDNYNIHYAWDFAASAKTPVYSIGEGVVKKVRFNQSSNSIDKSNGLGNYIEIEYIVENKIYNVIYGHLYPNSYKVKVGDEVKSWQEVALVGTTGYSTGNHLHFQVSLDGKKIDGLSLIDFNL